ncbi:MAG: hypothetical protein AABZ40_07960, partial [Thermodesulfobacteriota bacterium]
GGAVRVFRGVAFLKALPDLPEVFRKRVHPLGIPIPSRTSGPICIIDACVFDKIREIVITVNGNPESC